MSNVEVRLRIKSELKNSAEMLFENMGMTMSEAIRIFLTQAVNSCGLPFKPHLNKPNQTTINAFEAVKAGEFEEFTPEEFSSYLNEIANEKD